MLGRTDVVLLEHFGSYPTDPDMRVQLVTLDVAWVYDDSCGVAPSLQHLDGLPGMTRAFMSGSVTVYALDLNVLRTLKVSQG